MSWNVSGTWNGASDSVLGSDLPTDGTHGASILIKAGLVDPVAEASDEFNVFLVTAPAGTQLSQFNNDGTFVWPGNYGEYSSFIIGWTKNTIRQADHTVYVGIAPQVPTISSTSVIHSLGAIVAPRVDLPHIASESTIHALNATVGESVLLPHILSESVIHSLSAQVDTMVQLPYIGSTSAIFKLTADGGDTPTSPDGSNKKVYNRMYSSMKEGIKIS